MDLKRWRDKTLIGELCRPGPNHTSSGSTVLSRRLHGVSKAREAVQI
jgi:hypothetical protein